MWVILVYEIHMCFCSYFFMCKFVWGHIYLHVHAHVLRCKFPLYNHITAHWSPTCLINLSFALPIIVFVNEIILLLKNTLIQKYKTQVLIHVYIIQHTKIQNQKEHQSQPFIIPLTILFWHFYDFFLLPLIAFWLALIWGI